MYRSSIGFSSAAIRCATAALNALSGTVAGVIAIAAFFLVALVVAYSLAGVPAVVLAFTAALIGIYIARQAMAGDETFAFIRAMVIVFVSLGGTSFNGADLTQANFSGATLKYTNLTRATLTQTCWYQADGLDEARISCPILNNSKIRSLVLKGDEGKTWLG